MATFTLDSTAIAANTAKKTASVANIREGGAEQWYSIGIAHGGLTAAAQSETIELTDLTGKELIISDAFALLKTLFSGGGTSACTVEIGHDDGSAPDTDGIVLATDVFTGAGTGLKAQGAASKGPDVRDDLDAGGGTKKLESPLCKEAGAKITATFTVDGAHTVADLTAGEVTVYFKIAAPVPI